MKETRSFSYIPMSIGCALLALFEGFAISFAHDLLRYDVFAPHVLASFCPFFFVPIYAGRLLRTKAPLALPARLLPPLAPLLMPLPVRTALLQLMPAVRLRVAHHRPVFPPTRPKSRSS